MKSNVFSIEQLLKMDNSAIEGEFFNKEYKQYRIPLYQREYKWDSYRALELLEDIKAKKKLLGIVLFDSNTKDKVYEIVDGQQRITTLFFILIELYNLLETATIEQGTIIKTIKNEEKYILDNKSFGNDFIIEEDNKLCIDIKNDIYYQKENIKAVISSIRDNLNNCLNKEDVLSNLLGSQLVVIINEDTAGAFQDPVEQIFLDINEKSQGLDSEDIFKGYCFKNFGGRNIEVLKKDWEERKQELFSLRVPKDAETLHNLYMKICDIYIDAAQDYAKWMDDKNAATIKAAESKIHQAQTLTSEAMAIAKRMTS